MGCKNCSYVYYWLESYERIILVNTFVQNTFRYKVIVAISICTDIKIEQNVFLSIIMFTERTI